MEQITMWNMPWPGRTRGEIGSLTVPWGACFSFGYAASLTLSMLRTARFWLGWTRGRFWGADPCRFGLASDPKQAASDSSSLLSG